MAHDNDQCLLIAHLSVKPHPQQSCTNLIHNSPVLTSSTTVLHYSHPQQSCTILIHNSPVLTSSTTVQY